jgi:hypothetical protein
MYSADLYVVIATGPTPDGTHTEYLFSTSSLHTALVAVDALGVVAPDVRCVVVRSPDFPILRTGYGVWRAGEYVGLKSAKQLQAQREAALSEAC